MSQQVFNVCPGCGQYTDEKIIDPAGPFAVCPYCGHRHPLVQLPLFVITGASGAGKTTLCMQMVQNTQACVVMESDILWRMIAFNQWFIENAGHTEPVMQLLDTTAMPVAESAAAAQAWVLAHLPSGNGV